MAELSVRKSVTVNAPLEKAFAVFTERFDSWWPRGHKIGAADLQRAVIEPGQGGRWYEIGVDGSECEWGRVLEWDPPNRLVLAWQIDATWEFNPELVTEVEIRFASYGTNRTRIELEHRRLDRFGDAHDQMRIAFDSPGGWSGLLDAYAQAAGA